MTVEMNRCLSAYQKTASSQPQTKTVVVLLDGVLRHLVNAKGAYAEGRSAECLGLIGKASGILVGLQEQLRMEVSVDFVRRLRRFYGNCIVTISQLVSRKFDGRTYGGLVRRILKVRNAWATIADMKERTEQELYQPEPPELEAR